MGSYEIREQIGQGGMSTVYRAYHPGTERDVAVKVITRMMDQDEEAVRRFQREARLIARLEHPHILPVYDFDSSHAPPYIVMRLLNGGTLQTLLQQKSLELAEIGSLISQVCDALYYAHRQGIVHRDVKPSNILIDYEGHAFVADFGVARMIRSSNNQPITSTGAMVGTPDYMAPEQAYGRSDTDHRADIYALGIILFELLTGQKPFTADSVMGVVLKHLQEPPPSVLAYAPHLPAQIEPVLLRALAKEPNARYASATAFAEAALSALSITGRRQPLRLFDADQTQPLPAMDPPLLTPVEQYKNVTALFINAAEYVEILDAWPEAQPGQIAQFWQQTADTITGRGGWLVAQTEESLLAAWGGETVRENDGEQAARAALDAQNLIAEKATQIPWLRDRALPVTIALHAGPTLLARKGGAAPTLKGAVVSVATRLGHRPAAGVLLTQEVYNQTRGLFNVSPDAPLAVYQRQAMSQLAVYRLQAAKARAFAFRLQDVEGITPPLVGRQGELDQLQKALLETIEEGEGQFVTIAGAAGIGKSRLLNEFLSWVDLHPQQICLLTGRAAPDMQNRPYALLRQIISARFDIHDNDSPRETLQKLERGIQQQIGPDDRLAHFLGYLSGFDLPPTLFVDSLSKEPQQLTAEGQRLFYDWIEKLGRIDPVVIAIEDIHHADDASLDLFIELMSQSQNRPALFICSARAELYRRRPAWGGGLPGQLAISLKPLGKRDGRQLIDHLLQRVTDPPPQLYDLLMEQAEGNPYYLEELIRMLLDERIIVKDNEKVWRVEVGRLTHWQIPSSLSLLMQARLDSLLYPEKVVLKRASIIGRVFYDDALAFLDFNNDTHIDNLPAILRQLRERGFIYERESVAFKMGKEYIFASNMMRDALLGLLSPDQKRRYNLAAANWLIQTAADRVNEYGHIIAAYYERAGDLRQAAHHWRQAGQKALQVSAFAEAKKLFTAALALLTSADEGYAPILLHLGETDYWLSDYAAAQQRLAEALAASRQGGQTAYEANALYWLSQVAAREGNYDQAGLLLKECLPLARKQTDESLLAHVLFGLGDLAWRRGEFDLAQTCCAESLAIARQLNAPGQILQALNRLGAIAMSQYDEEEARRLYEETYRLAQQTGVRIYAASALNNLGEIERVNGSFSAAERFYQQALAITRETRQHSFTALLHTNLATAALALDNMAEAREQLREGLRLSAQIGAGPMMLAAIQKSGWWLLKQGEQERGLALLQLSRQHPTADSESAREVEEILVSMGWPPAEQHWPDDLPAALTRPLPEIAADLLLELEG